MTVESTYTWRDAIRKWSFKLRGGRFGVAHSRQSSVREFVGAMVIQGALRGIFVTSGGFSKAAVREARDASIREPITSIELVDGERLIAMCELARPVAISKFEYPESDIELNLSEYNEMSTSHSSSIESKVAPKISRHERNTALYPTRRFARATANGRFGGNGRRKARSRLSLDQIADIGSQDFRENSLPLPDQGVSFP
jgi:hypothetical protein